MRIEVLIWSVLAITRSCFSMAINSNSNGVDNPGGLTTDRPCYILTNLTGQPSIFKLISPSDVPMFHLVSFSNGKVKSHHYVMNESASGYPKGFKSTEKAKEMLKQILFKMDLKSEKELDEFMNWHEEYDKLLEVIRLNEMDILKDYIQEPELAGQGDNHHHYHIYLNATQQPNILSGFVSRNPDGKSTFHVEFSYHDMKSNTNVREKRDFEFDSVGNTNGKDIHHFYIHPLIKVPTSYSYFNSKAQVRRANYTKIPFSHADLSKLLPKLGVIRVNTSDPSFKIFLQNYPQWLSRGLPDPSKFSPPLPTPPHQDAGTDSKEEDYAYIKKNISAPLRVVEYSNFRDKSTEVTSNPDEPYGSSPTTSTMAYPQHPGNIGYGKTSLTTSTSTIRTKTNEKLSSPSQSSIPLHEDFKNPSNTRKKPNAYYGYEFNDKMALKLATVPSILRNLMNYNLPLKNPVPITYARNLANNGTRSIRIMPVPLTTRPPLLITSSYTSTFPRTFATYSSNATSHWTKTASTPSTPINILTTTLPMKSSLGTSTLSIMPNSSTSSPLTITASSNQSDSTPRPISNGTQSVSMTTSPSLPGGEATTFPISTPVPTTKSKPITNITVPSNSTITVQPTMSANSSTVISTLNPITPTPIIINANTTLQPSIQTNLTTTPTSTITTTRVTSSTVETNNNVTAMPTLNTTPNTVLAQTNPTTFSPSSTSSPSLILPASATSSNASNLSTLTTSSIPTQSFSPNLILATLSTNPTASILSTTATTTTMTSSNSNQSVPTIPTDGLTSMVPETPIPISAATFTVLTTTTTTEGTNITALSTTSPSITTIAATMTTNAPNTTLLSTTATPNTTLTFPTTAIIANTTTNAATITTMTTSISTVPLITTASTSITTLFTTIPVITTTNATITTPLTTTAVITTTSTSITTLLTTTPVITTTSTSIANTTTSIIPPTTGNETQTPVTTLNISEVEKDDTTIVPTTIESTTPKPELASSIITGGRNEYFVPTSTIDKIEEDGKSCTVSTFLPATRYDHMAIMYGKSLVICGGHTSGQQTVTKRCDAYNSESQQWNLFPTLEFPLRNAAIVVVDEVIYLIGGFSTSPSDKVMTFSKDTGSWDTLNHRLNVPRESPCAVESNGFIIVTGGKMQSQSQALDLDSVEILDTSNPDEGWKFLPKMLNKRKGHGCAIVTNPQTGQIGVMVAGGSGAFLDVQRSVEFLSLQSPNSVWESRTPLQKPRCCWPQMGFIGNKLFILSGEQGPSNSLETWDQNTGAWTISGQTLSQKRLQSRAVFMTPTNFLKCP